MENRLSLPGTEKAVDVLKDVAEDLYHASHDLKNIDRYSNGWLRRNLGRATTMLTKSYPLGNEEVLIVSVSYHSTEVNPKVKMRVI